MAAAKKYRVLNPRGMANGTWIVRFGKERWFAGDEFAPPKGFDKDGRLERNGFVERVKAGRSND